MCKLCLIQNRILQVTKGRDDDHVSFLRDLKKELDAHFKQVDILGNTDVKNSAFDLATLLDWHNPDLDNKRDKETVSFDEPVATSGSMASWALNARKAVIRDYNLSMQNNGASVPSQAKEDIVRFENAFLERKVTIEDVHAMYKRIVEHENDEQDKKRNERHAQIKKNLDELKALGCTVGFTATTPKADTTQVTVIYK